MGNTYMHVNPNRHHGYNRAPPIPHNSPPSLLKKQSEARINHLISTRSRNIKKNKSAQIMMCGDFNNPDTSEITNIIYPFNQIASFATGESNTLDLVFTDIDGYKTVGCKREPPILTNDRCAITSQLPINHLKIRV